MYNKPVKIEKVKIKLTSICDELEPVYIYLDPKKYEVFPQDINIQNICTKKVHHLEVINGAVNLIDLVLNYVPSSYFNYLHNSQYYYKCIDLFSYIELLAHCSLHAKQNNNIQYLIDLFHKETERIKKVAKRELNEYPKESEVYQKILLLEGTLLQFLYTNFNTDEHNTENPKITF